MRQSAVPAIASRDATSGDRPETDTKGCTAGLGESLWFGSTGSHDLGPDRSLQGLDPG